MPHMVGDNVSGSLKHMFSCSRQCDRWQDLAKKNYSSVLETKEKIVVIPDDLPLPGSRGL